MSSDLLFEVNSEVLQHLADIDGLLLEINDMQATRAQGQEEQLKMFIQDGYIQQLSHRDGIYIITQKQITNYQRNLTKWNDKVDSVNDALDNLRKEAVQLLQSSKITQQLVLQKMDQAISQIEEETEEAQRPGSIDRSKSAIGGKSNQEYSPEEYELMVDQRVEQGVRQRVKEITKGFNDEIAILRSQLLSRDSLIKQFFSNNEVSAQQDLKMSQTTNDNSAIFNLDSKLSEDTVVNTVLKDKILQLEGELTKMREIHQIQLQNIERNANLKLQSLEKELKKQSVLLIEEPDSSSEQLDIECSNSRTLFVMDLQKSIYTLQEEKEMLEKEFKQYKQEKEQELKLSQQTSIQVEEYKQKIENLVSNLTNKTRSSLQLEENCVKEIDALQKQVLELNRRNQELKDKLVFEEQTSSTGIRELKAEVERLGKELSIKDEAIKGCTPAELRINSSNTQKKSQDHRITYIQEQQNNLTGGKDSPNLKSNSDITVDSLLQTQSQLKDALQDAQDRNQILLSLLQTRNDENNGNNISTGDGVTGKEDFGLLQYYKSKYSESMMNCDNLSVEITKQQDTINKLKNQLKQQQLLHKPQNKLIQSTEISNNSKNIIKAKNVNIVKEKFQNSSNIDNCKISAGLIGTNDGNNQEHNSSTNQLYLEQYKPLSSSIQAILQQNEELKKQNHALTFQVSTLMEEIQSLQNAQQIHTPGSNDSHYYEDFMSNNNNNTAILEEGSNSKEIKSDQMELSEQLFLIKTVAASKLLLLGGLKK